MNTKLPHYQFISASGSLAVITSEDGDKINIFQVSEVVRICDPTLKAPEDRIAKILSFQSPRSEPHIEVSTDKGRVKLENIEKLTRGLDPANEKVFDSIEYISQTLKVLELPHTMFFVPGKVETDLQKGESVKYIILSRGVSLLCYAEDGSVVIKKVEANQVVELLAQEGIRQAV